MSRILLVLAALAASCSAPAVRSPGREPGPVAAPLPVQPSGPHTQLADEEHQRALTATPQSDRAVLLPRTDVPVTFDQGSTRLEGTIALPARWSGTQHPGVIIVHGTGPMSRDGTMPGQLGLGFGFEIAVYRELAEALAHHGYAVLRYDKRTCGPTAGCSNRYAHVPYVLAGHEFTTEQYIRDAEAALKRLADDPAVDPQRLFYIGHSQGGELIPELLARSAGVRAGVMLAAPFSTPDELVAQQAERIRWAFERIGKGHEATREHAILAKAASQLRALRRGVHLGEPILGQPPEVWRSWLSAAERAPRYAHELGRPLLVLGGEYDYNVEPREILQWKEWLSKSLCRQHRVRVLPCVTHALNCISEPEPTRIGAEDIGRDLSPELVHEILLFLGIHGAPKDERGLRPTSLHPASSSP